MSYPLFSPSETKLLCKLIKNYAQNVTKPTLMFRLETIDWTKTRNITYIKEILQINKGGNSLK